eukprot:1349118-Amorphochlora_amoeboformis.AAC.2
MEYLVTPKYQNPEAHLPPCNRHKAPSRFVPCAEGREKPRMNKLDILSRPTCKPTQDHRCARRFIGIHGWDEFRRNLDIPEP